MRLCLGMLAVAGLWVAPLFADEAGGTAAGTSPDSAAASPADQNGKGDAETVPARRELFRGKVVRLADALKRRKVTAFSEIEDQVVLETADGRLIPIVPDWRGRAFFQDQRLRDREVELVGYQPEKTPYLKVLMVFTADEKGERQYTDYWCDICAIPMYEIKPCDCCQGPIRLRFQPRELPEYVEQGGESSARTSDR
ncbi:MAG: hypothetical protein KY476_13345 [Planctomycetes bacterium]|nr:hypothetical protein [Planctomycetota bacterium]